MSFTSTAQLRRDPFGRCTLYRMVLAPQFRKQCKWCGKPNAKYNYVWISDGVNRLPTSFNPTAPFCNQSCHDAYHAGS